MATLENVAMENAALEDAALENAANENAKAAPNPTSDVFAAAPKPAGPHAAN